MRTPRARRALVWAITLSSIPAAVSISVSREPPVAAAALPEAPAAPATSAERIVSTAPSATEVLFALGAGPRVVAVTRFCDYPPEARALPKVGGFLDLSYEATASMRPDLVVGTRNASNREVVERISASGVRVLFPPAGTLEETLAAITIIGDAVGAGGRARAVVGEMRRGIGRISGALAGAPRPKVLFVYGHRPLVVAGRGTFADELVRIARADNVVGEGNIRYPTYPLEEIVRLGPDVIVDAFMTGSSGGSGASPFSDFSSIPAVRSGRVLSLDAPELMRPGPRLVAALHHLAKALHPGLLGG